MQIVRIPHTTIDAPRILAGCMGLGGGWSKDAVLGPVYENEVRAFIDTSLELGINFFDHANIYAHGRAEEVFGRILKERPSLRGQIFIQSKAGIRWADNPPGTPQRFDFSRKHLLEAVEGSLRRLGIEQIDILLLHRPDVLWEGEEIAEAFAALKASGKVRYFGVSNQNRFQIEYLQSFLPDPLVANQVQMSLLHSGFAEVSVSFNQTAPRYPDGWEGLLEYCRLKGVNLQAWAPLAKGALTGDLAGQPENVVATAALVKKLAEEHGTTPEAIQLAWLLRHPAGIRPVLGTKNPERLRACAKAVDVNLSREEWYSLFAAGRGKAMP